MPNETVIQQPYQAAQSFLSACADIEKTLKDRYGLSNVKGLGDVLREVKRKDATVRRYDSALTAFVDLRNTISHSRYENGSPIATPLQATIDSIEKIRDEIVNPTKVEAKVRSSDMVTYRPSDQLRQALKQMAAKSFSQVPVYDAENYIGLLTNNAVARWVASHLDDYGYALIENASVSDVLDFAEDYERAKHISRSTHVTKALDLLLSEKAPLALIVTQSGAATERPIGILVAADLPRLLEGLPSNRL